MDEAGFLRAIAADPEADAPRLIYADWLDESGRGERAEFIRLQCEAERLPGGEPACGLLRRRAEILRETHERDWLPADDRLSWLGLSLTWRRGFVAEVRVASRSIRNNMGTLADLAHFPLVEVVELGAAMGDEEFARMPGLRNLKRLQFSGNARITHQSAAALAGLPALRSLTLPEGWVEAGLLAAVGQLTRLEELDLSYNPLVTDGSLALLTSLSGLRRLGLAYTAVTAGALAVLTGFSRLRVLDLQETAITADNCGGLAGLGALEELRLGSRYVPNPPGDAALEPLLGFSRLAVLDAGFADPSDGFVGRLCRTLPLRELWISGERRV